AAPARGRPGRSPPPASSGRCDPQQQGLMWIQVINVIGAGLILGAYIAYQRGWIGRERRLYNLMNFVGAILLAWVAIIDLRWGFIILETVWAAVSLPPLLRPPAAGPPARES
ncbi:MAG: CBU_0592 family membrane protein, partial [Gemmatimonadota bacterium]